MAKRLTDRKKKQIIADYAELGSYNATAKKHKISNSTVRRIILGDPKSTEIANEKKEQNTLDMLAFMDSRKGQAQSFVDMCLAYLANPEKFDKARLSEITTAMGTVIDKFTSIPPGTTPSQGREAAKGLSTEELKKLASQIAEYET